MSGLKDLLQGKPMRSPLHPALVHLPIALFPLSLIFDFASLVLPQADVGLVRAAFGCIVAGLFTGTLAGIVGMVDYTEIRDDHPAKRPATLHLVLNLVMLGLFAAGAGLRYGVLNTVPTPVAPLLLSIVGVAVLGYSGFLGGRLVYDDGIAVGRHRRSTRLPENTIVRETHEGEAIAVADESALGEGETLRVALDGVVITVARVGGRVEAFQEFCTHRYAPLSEGALRGCEVVCPWHNSRFDIRSGKVTHGPAKVDLRTFHVETRAGKIWLTPPPRTGA